MKATSTFGAANKLQLAQIVVPVRRTGIAAIGSTYETIDFYALPELNTSKTSEFANENIIGRSFPIKSYVSSGDRTIGLKCPFFAQRKEDIAKNWKILRLLESTVYPDDDTTVFAYIPPPICLVRVGYLLTAENNGFLSVVIRSVTPSYPTDVAWDESTYLPYAFEIDLQMEVIFANNRLPGQNRIINDVPR